MEDNQKQIGVNCPECGSHIVTPLDHVLFADKLICDSCSLEFSPDKTSATELWKQVQQKQLYFLAFLSNSSLFQASLTDTVFTGIFIIPQASA